MSINKQEFTNGGRSMLGRANAGETLTITKVVVGSGQASAPADLWPLPALITHELDVAILQKVDQGNGILLVDASFNSSQAPRAFDLRELGVMARIGAEAERLYSVANVMATGADHVDPAVESIHAFKVKVVIDRAPDVTIVIGESRDIMAENIGAETVGPGWFAEKIGNTLRFKRALEGAGIELTETAETIRIGQKILEVDLDLYVPLSHPEAPGPEVAFPTIQAAWDSLAFTTIPTGRQATINVAAGRHTLASPLLLIHPNGDRIHIVGVEPVPVPLIAGASTWAVDTVRAYQFNLTLPPATYDLLEIGDVLSFWAQGAGDKYLTDGAHLVSGKWAGNEISVLMRSPIAGLDAPYVWEALILRYPTQLQIETRFTEHTISIGPPGLGSLRNMAIREARGASNNYTIFLSEPPNSVFLDNVAISNSDFYLVRAGGSGASIKCRSLFLGDAEAAIVVQLNASLECLGDRALAVGSMGANALWITGGIAMLSGTRVVASEVGILSHENSTVRLWLAGANLTTTAFNRFGAYASSRGYIASNVSYHSQNTMDLQATTRATIHLIDNQGTTSFTTNSPALNVVGNGEAVILRGNFAQEEEEAPEHLPKRGEAN